MIVVARGGGSLADLFAFCDETLCRTVAMLRVPVDRLRRPPHRPHADRRRRRGRLLDADPRRRGGRARSTAPRPAPRCAARPRGSSARAAARSSSARARSPRLSRAPAHHVARHRTRLHQQLRELRASSARAVDRGRAREPPPRAPRSSATRGPAATARRRARHARRSRSPRTTRSAPSSAATRSSRARTASRSRAPPRPPSWPELVAAHARRRACGSVPTATYPRGDR